MSLRIRRMERQFSGLNSFQQNIHEKLDVLISMQHCTIPQPSLQSIPSGSNRSTSNLTTPHPPVNPSSSLVSIVPATTDSVDTSAMVNIHLASGPFSFHKSKAQPPPAQHFSKDIPSLFREWECSTLLQIDGRGIPVRDWDKVYKKRVGLFPRAWQAIRVQWGNWKVRDNIQAITVAGY